jgi:hypothetical protein
MRNAKYTNKPLFVVSYLVGIIFSQKYWDAPFIPALIIGLPLAPIIFYFLLTIYEFLIEPLLKRFRIIDTDQ